MWKALSVEELIGVAKRAEARQERYLQMWWKTTERVKRAWARVDKARAKGGGR